MGKDSETCGRCSMTTVVDATDADENRDPFGDESIEVTDDELRAVSPAAWLEGVTQRLDDIASKITDRR